MGEGNDGIDVFSRSFLPERFCQLVYDAIYTAYRGDNPYLVTDSHITVPATVAVKGQTFVGNVQSRVLRLPGIVLQTFQIRFDILLVYQGACGYILPGMSDRETVLDDGLACFKVLQRHFVTGRNFFADSDGGGSDSYIISCR